MICITPLHWKLKVTAGIGNTKGIGPYTLLNQSNQPT
jgi:hypothetical protein